MTYSELDAQANRIAHLLRRRGVGAGSRVVTLFHRSIDMVIACLATLKAGAAYVPADPEYPPARVAHMLADSGAAMVMTTSALARSVELSCEQLCLDDAETVLAISAENDENLPHEGSVFDEAYVIYTSGTTGKPKGVMIAHEQLDALVKWHARAFDVTAADRATQIAGPAFDASVFEIWPCLLAGASIGIPDEDTKLDPEKLRDWLVADRTTIAFLPTALAEPLLSLEWPDASPLRLLLTGGDRLTKRPSASARFALYNLYGPTECTVCATSGCVAPAGSATVGSPSIGGPIDGTSTYVLDPYMEPLPVGVPGELYIGGAGVGNGYAGRASLTAERFVPDPFAEQGARMYRTGDLVRWRRDGALEFFGRLDHQVKIRGLRIELGEIEAVLGACEDVQEAVVVALGEAAHEKRLVAYVVPRSSAALDAKVLKAVLSESLPDYMVPSAFVFLDALPLTPNGKVDRKALPAPDFAAAAAEYVGPRTPTEEILAGIFRDVLGIERVGIHDDFFALGGHSLLAMKVLAPILAQIGVSVPVRALFAAPTVAQLAKHLEGERAAPEGPRLERVAERHRALLSYQQQMWWSRQEARPDSPENSFVDVHRMRGALDVDAFARSVHEVVRRQEALRTTYELVDGQPMQIVHDPRADHLERIDLENAPETALRDLLVEKHEKRWERGRIEAARMILVRLAKEEHVFVLVSHRIAFDAVCSPMLVSDVIAIYDAAMAGKPSPLAEPLLQNIDYATWQHAMTATPDALRRLAVAKARVAGAEPVALPYDRPEPERPTTRLHDAAVPMGDRVWSSVTNIARAESTSEFVVLSAAFKAYLSMVTGQSDVMTNAPTRLARGLDARLASVFGVFGDYYMLRTRLTPTSTLREIIRREHVVVDQAQRDVDLPAMLVMGDSHGPLWRVVINVVLDAAGDAERIQSTSGIVTEGEGAPGKHKGYYDLTWGVWSKEGPTVLFAGADRFDASTLSRLGAELGSFLSQLLASPDTPYPELWLARKG